MEVEAAVREESIAYKRWLQVKTTEAKEEYLKMKRAAGHEIRKAKRMNVESWVNHCRVTMLITKGSSGLAYDLQ